jgi:hypothetical protein
MSKNPIKIPIYAPDDEAKKFILFKQYFETFSILLEKGVFEQKSAAITLHFDHLGVLQSVRRADSLYEKRFE